MVLFLIVWLFNICGGDVFRVFLLLVVVIINKDGMVILFVELEKLIDEICSYFGNEVVICLESEFVDGLCEMQGKIVCVDLLMVLVWVYDQLNGGGVIVQELEDLVMCLKVVKNEVEVEGLCQVYICDGVVIMKFLYWLDMEVQFGEVDEIQVVCKLEVICMELFELWDLFFDMIFGVQGNVVFVYYCVLEESNFKLVFGFFYLVDSGG